jgi:hypothetical protein
MNISAEKNRQNTTSTLFYVQAECLDQKGETVTRRLGLVRGMSDNGRPGWTQYGGTGYRTLIEAQEAAKFPYSYSVYDGHYKGGVIRVLEIETHTVTTVTTYEHPVE